jgi:HEAT repeat protein
VSSPHSPDDLLAAREGTGVGFPAAVTAHARARGGPAALADAVAWCGSPDPSARLVGLELLGALVAPGAPAPPPGAREQLLEHARRAAAEGDEDLRWVAAKVLGQAGAAALPALLALAGDPAGDVRWQVVSSLPLAAGSPPDPAALAALLAAADDEDPEVRDQAVFALALQLDVDSPAVREALLAHLHDAREDTAAQAARGLGLRGDDRVVPVLLERLATEDPDALADLDEAWVEAAGDLADPRLLPPLRSLRERPGAEHLAEAVADALARGDR